MKQLNRYGGWICIITGIIVCIGWFNNSLNLISLFMNNQPMKFNTAVCFIVIGIAYQLHWWYKKWSLALSVILHLACFAFALLTALQYAGLQLSIDEFFIKDTLTGSATPGRMSLITAVCFILTNLAGVAYISKHKYKYYFVLAGASALSFFSFIALLTNLYDIEVDKRAWFISSMALHTSLLFLLIAFVFLMALLRKGYLLVFTTNRIAGKASRRFAVLFACTLVVLGMVEILVVRMGWLSNEFAVVLLINVAVGITITSVYFISTYLMKMEDEQINAIETLKQLNEEIGGSTTDGDDEINETEAHAKKFTELVQQTKELSKELNYKNGLLKDYVNITSHNLRSPVANLSALLQLHDMTVADDEKKEYIGKFKEVTQQLLEMLNGMMEMLSVEYKDDVPTDTIYLTALVDKIQTILQTQIHESEATIHYNFEVPTIPYPPAYIESILLNLISNGIKYRSPDRKVEITIATKQKNHTIELTVTDNGKGINMEKNGDKLFGLFNTFHTNKDAQGLGLYMVKKQVEKMGGVITATSIEGVGTTFTVTIL